jgi:hypothetical protein
VAALDGTLDLAVDARVQRKAIQMAAVSPAVLDALTDGQGYLAVPLRVTGTRDAPVVRPDVGALMARAGQDAKHTLLGKAADHIGKLFH